MDLRRQVERNGNGNEINWCKVALEWKSSNEKKKKKKKEGEEKKKRCHERGEGREIKRHPTRKSFNSTSFEVLINDQLARVILKGCPCQIHRSAREKGGGRRGEENGIGIARAGNPSWNVFFDSSRFASSPCSSPLVYRNERRRRRRKKKKQTTRTIRDPFIERSYIYIDAFPCVFLRISRRLMKFKGVRNASFVFHRRILLSFCRENTTWLEK